MPLTPDATVVTIYNHQQVRQLPDGLLARWESAARRAVPLVLSQAKGGGTALELLDEVEVSVVDDATIADVHLRFMDIPGATDVITFDHGEIHVSVETAARQAAEFGTDFESELMLYIVHGLVHLAGHEDGTDAGREEMERIQRQVMDEVWAEVWPE